MANDPAILKDLPELGLEILRVKHAETPAASGPAVLSSTT
jgi:hypothetical protein